MDEKLKMLEGLEFVKFETDSGDSVRDNMMDISFANNLPACDGPVYSNTFWLPETVEELVDDLRYGILGN